MLYGFVRHMETRANRVLMKSGSGESEARTTDSLACAADGVQRKAHLDRAQPQPPGWACCWDRRGSRHNHPCFRAHLVELLKRTGRTLANRAMLKVPKRAFFGEVPGRAGDSEFDGASWQREPRLPESPVTGIVRNQKQKRESGGVLPDSRGGCPRLWKALGLGREETRNNRDLLRRCIVSCQSLLFLLGGFWQLASARTACGPYLR